MDAPLISIGPAPHLHPPVSAKRPRLLLSTQSPHVASSKLIDRWRLCHATPLHCPASTEMICGGARGKLRLFSLTAVGMPGASVCSGPYTERLASHGRPFMLFLDLTIFFIDFLPHHCSSQSETCWFGRPFMLFLNLTFFFIDFPATPLLITIWDLLVWSAFYVVSWSNLPLYRLSCHTIAHHNLRLVGLVGLLCCFLI